jgi:hypothetical protein
MAAIAVSKAMQYLITCDILASAKHFQNQKFEANHSEAVVIRRIKNMLFLLSILGMATVCMAANPPTEPQDPGKDWEHLRQPSQNIILKVVVKGAGAIQGEWLSADETSLTLMWNGAQRRIGREEVIEVYQLQSKSRGKRALIGAAIGVGSGLGAGAIVDSKTHDNWFPNIGKQVLTPTGAIVGAIIGAVLPARYWQKIYGIPATK